MRSLLVLFTAVFTSGVFSDVLEPMAVDREVGDGVNNWNLGRKIVYGDEDMTIINEAITDMDKISGLKSKVALREHLQPLDPQDVKCLMSVDKYCSKEMGVMKNILVQALKDDCRLCTSEQKENAGRTIASMMAYDPVAWKLFLTRSALLIKHKTKRDISKNMLEEPRLKAIGEPEEILESKNRYVEPGSKVRVRRYSAVKLKFR